MTNNSTAQLTRRSRKGVAALLTAVVGATLAATMAGPVPSASALIRSDEAGGPGHVDFLNAKLYPTPVLQADRAAGNKVALSTGALMVTPDRTAEKGAQTVQVTYYLYKRDANGVFRSFREAKSVHIPLSDGGHNLARTVPGSGTIATVEHGKRESYSIRVAVRWYVSSQWQSVVFLKPDLSREVDCNDVSGCSVHAPGNKPASLGIV